MQIILGINDGLVSMFLLVFGMAGGGSDSFHILLAAVTGAIAGAISMALGEYVRVCISCFSMKHAGLLDKFISLIHSTPHHHLALDLIALTDRHQVAGRGDGERPCARKGAFQASPRR